MRHTKIVCTIGPASSDKAVLSRILQSGMNVARLNFSHGDRESHAAVMKTLTELSRELGLPVAVMQDLQGPKIRVAERAAPLELAAGQQVVIGKDLLFDIDVSKFVRPDERILIDDGLIALKVQKVEGTFIFCETLNGGAIESHKGVNIPDSTVPFPAMTEKDIADLTFGLSRGVDMVAVSFVRSAQDIRTVRDLIERQKAAQSDMKMPQVIAKMEKREAVGCFDEIVAAADGVMVARGDLGVEMPEEEIALLQKMMVGKCKAAGKPVIVATQMLDSMIREPRPTRAEVSDVSNAVIDGADYLMLSNETAVGKYPVEAVQEMARIIDVVEASSYAPA